ncbi:uncharacterized protein PgNI_04220 [Pyricularia grisea]|uniref:PABS domain-containing protein n=1 Tax=Pyricularia grisea TaxID=148305 RepID=A0A6P8B9C7_PYRGI|nr:uncharacterized protein PgNI_04220 [Pyricularia grisea]TLD12411.1 hypothetical protein PgNI_04220 [Pyricularia grisea]
MAAKKRTAVSKEKNSKPDAVNIDPNTSFTPESFEKELKALAAKAQTETWGNAVREQAWVYVRPIALLSLLAVYSNVSQLSLSPVYGAIPSSLYHGSIVITSCFVGWAANLLLQRALPRKVRLVHLVPIVALYIPMTQHFLFKYSNVLGVRYGPLVTELLTLFPLIVVVAACCATYLEGADFSLLPKWLADPAPGALSWSVYRGMEVLSGNWLQNNIGQTFVATRMGAQLVLGGLFAMLAPSKLLLLAIPGLLHTVTLNPHVMTQNGMDRLNGTLQTQNWTIIDRKESLTGYISVIENQDSGFRVMRCDHSLLGGEWVRYGRNIVSEPIYGIFVMLEAVRLVKREVPVPDEKAKALIVGMGIGTTPSALIAHGIDTTIVEIDPAVYEFAAKHFYLLPNHTPVIDDAVAYAKRLASSSDKRFDYIVNDVFTGGAEPVELFTLEFLSDLRTLLNPDGVIAINYAGDFALPPPRIVLNTIKQVFPNSCRIYREHARNETQVAETNVDFTNMVIFCRKTETSTPLTFREPIEKDMLDSVSRVHFLLPKHEVLESEFLSNETSVLRRNNTQILEKWHKKSAMGHWEVMRTVVPLQIWESW